jgi:hypothetical protein
MRLRDSLHRERMMIDCAPIRLILLLFSSAKARVTTRCRDGCKNHLGMNGGISAADVTVSSISTARRLEAPALSQISVRYMSSRSHSRQHIPLRCVFLLRRLLLPFLCRHSTTILLCLRIIRTDWPTRIGRARDSKV